MENKIERPGEKSTDLDTKIENILGKREGLYGKDKKATHEEIVNFIHKKLLDKYGPYECQKYAMYDAVVNGRRGQKWSEFPPNRIDFPGEESIEKLINKLDKIREIKERVLTLYGREDLDEVMDIQGEITDFLKNLEVKYSNDHREYILYHVVGGSGPGIPWFEFSNEKIDFPGDDSIEKFIKSLEEKYKDK